MVDRRLVAAARLQVVVANEPHVLGFGRIAELRRLRQRPCRHQSHQSGGSHGSLVAGDSLVPLVTVGLRSEPRRIVEVAPALLEHFGVPVPGSMEALAGVG